MVGEMGGVDRGPGGETGGEAGMGKENGRMFPYETTFLGCGSTRVGHLLLLLCPLCPLLGVGWGSSPLLADSPGVILLNSPPKEKRRRKKKKETWLFHHKIHSEINTDRHFNHKIYYEIPEPEPG